MKQEDSNVVKGIAVIMLYIHHLFWSDRWKSYEITFGGVKQETVVSFAVFCRVCVALFVFISAYGISKKYEQKKIGGIGRLWGDACIRYFKLVSSMWIVWLPFLLLSCIIKIHTFSEVYCAADKNTIIYGIQYFVIDMLGLSNLLGTPTYNTTWWYVSLATILIFVTPLINMIYDKIRLFIIPCIVFLSVFWNRNGLEISEVQKYCIGIGTAIVIAREQVFEIYYNYSREHKKQNTLYVLLTLGLIYIGYEARKRELFSFAFIDNMEAVLIVFLCNSVFSFRKMKILKRILAMMGRHSANMYFVHGFIFAFFFQNFSYSFKNAWLILGVLILDTLAISVVIEHLKKPAYNKLIGRVTEYMDHSYK